MGVKRRPIVTRNCEDRRAKFHTGDRPCQREIPLQRGSLPSSPAPAPCSGLFGGPRDIRTPGENAFPACDKGGWQGHGRRRNPLKKRAASWGSWIGFLQTRCSHAISGSRDLLAQHWIDLIRTLPRFQKGYSVIFTQLLWAVLVSSFSFTVIAPILEMRYPEAKELTGLEAVEWLLCNFTSITYS